MCFDDGASPPISLSAGSQARGERLGLSSGDGTQFAAYLASPEDVPQAQVLILPDVRGLHRFYEELALRFADIGIRALVIDYFARTAEDDRRDDSFEFMPHVMQMTPDTFATDLVAAFDYLQEVATGKLATFTVGFCMGGSLSFWAGTRIPELAGVIGFYAGLTRLRGAVTPVLDWAEQIEVPLLGLFGGADETITKEEIDRLQQSLQANGIEHEIVVYPGAPHSFFDRRAIEHAQASADAWSRIQGFISDHRVNAW